MVLIAAMAAAGIHGGKANTSTLEKKSTKLIPLLTFPA